MPADNELVVREVVQQYQEESPTGLALMKKRQDSATDQTPARSPSSNGDYHQLAFKDASSRRPFSDRDIVPIIRDTVTQARRKIISDFEHIDGALLDGFTIQKFSDYIARERLSSMPHRGSLWDRVLRWAEFYALQVAAYADIIGPFVPESQRAAKQIFTLLRSLLELGEINASALDTTFGVFYKTGLSLAFLCTHEGKLALDSHVREDVGRAFHDLHTLVFDVASYYQRTVRGLSHGAVALDFIQIFHNQLTNFYRRKSLIIHHIWRHSLGETASKDVQRIRSWLNQRAVLLKSPSLDHHIPYDEYTCQWFQRHLLDFSRSEKSVLAVTAGAGTGKTILSSWIQERLQRPIDRKTYSTVMYTFDADYPSQNTSLALAKGLALQLLDAHVGNARMFEAIMDAYYCKDPAAVEQRLWNAIDAAYTINSDPSMIIIDGLDLLQGSMTNACTRISDLSAKHSALRTIILSRPSPVIPTKDKDWRSLVVSPDHVYEDMLHIGKHLLQGCQQFLLLGHSEKDTVLEQLVKTASGSFLWMSLVVDTLKLSKSREDFHKAMGKLPQTIDELVRKRADAIDLTDPDMKLLLSYLLVAERPLTTRELYSILQVDLQRKTNTQRQIELTEKINKAARVLHVDENGMVRFRHSALRVHFDTIQAKGERLLSAKIAHTEMTLRLLTYSKASLTKKHDVSLDLLPHADIERLYTDHNLLEYAVQSWTTHFRQSTLFRATGALDLPSTFKDSLPSSPYMGLLELSSWDDHTSLSEVFEMHDISLRVRSEVFEKHECTLQSIIICALVHERYTSMTLAAGYYFHASRVGQVVLPKYSKITISCTERFLVMTETTSFITRTETASWREEMLKYLISAYKHTHGETSDIVIRYYKALAELYVSIQEEEHAAEYWKILRLIIIEKHGEGSDAEKEISGKLIVVLKQNDDDEIDQYQEEIFSVGEEVSIVWDAARISVFLKLALTFERRKEYYESEEIYVTLWSRLLHYCRHQHSNDIEFRINTLRVAIEYSDFLNRRGRDEEAKNLLLLIWTEHQNFGAESEAFYLQLSIIGERMRSLGLLTVSVSILEKVLQWFKAVGKSDHDEVRRCERFIIEIVEEITKEGNSNQGESTAEIETVLRRMFSSTTVVTKEYLQVMRTAVELRVRKEQWAEAIDLLTKCLQLLWTKTSWGGEMCLPNEFVDEAIEFSMELGRCYMKCRHHQESLACYVQLWQAVRSACSFSDKRRMVVVDILTGFYREHKRWRLLIELYKELLVEYRRNVGRSHQQTISILYLLGDSVLEHGYGYAEDYYREIVELIGTVNPKSSFKAYKMLCQIYYDESNWGELKLICDVLWDQLTNHHGDHEFDADLVEIVYIRYSYVNRHHSNSDHAGRCLLALQYKQICILKFGAASPIAVRARLEYASVLMESDVTKVQAIDMYEEIMTISKGSKTPILDEGTLTLLKKRMAEAYIYAHGHGSASPAMIERAIIVLQERYEQLKNTLGCAHPETLVVFTELVTLEFTLNGAKNAGVILRRLDETVIEIVTKEQSSQLLFAAADTIGSLYLVCGFVSQGLALVHEIRRQVIAKHTQHSKGGFKMDKSVGRLSFVFLVTFELKLKGSVGHSHSEVMADWLTEWVLFENFNRCLESQAKVEVLLMRGARLRSFWALHGRHDEINAFDQQVFEVFNKNYGGVVKMRPEIIRVFLIALLVHVGSHETRNKQVELARVASIAGNEKTAELLKAGKYSEAHEVGQFTFHFVRSQGGYHEAGLIGTGFTLAGYMAGRIVEKDRIPAELRARMLHTSREIMAEVLSSCKNLRINFQRLHDHELRDLVELLGEQENYSELESILASLWTSRHGQKHWTEDTLIKLGMRLVQSRHLSGKTESAIQLAEDISYNLHRVLGGLHPHALAMSSLLSQLYTSAGEHSSALTVHEQILHLIVAGDDGEDGTVDGVEDVAVARAHLDLLKAAFQRNEGWVRSAASYKTLVGQLLLMPQFRRNAAFDDLQPIAKWVPKQDENTARLGGMFVKPAEWYFIVGEDCDGLVGDAVQQNGDEEDGLGKLVGPSAGKQMKKSGWSLRRSSENWGMSVTNGGEDGPVLRAEVTY